ncbi:AN1-type zinc finger domain-containing protein [Methanogenium marinum]|uniref:AN1-type zinc finger domain-containing protein n=1 Tax=Methanogenium marinum TaxID=348610 RepID=UPI003B847F1B
MCGRDDWSIRPCRYCGKIVCTEHRLPENHCCTGNYNHNMNFPDPIGNFEIVTEPTILKKVKCEVCGRDDWSIRPCRYCGKIVCTEHRLPENHCCTGNYNHNMNSPDPIPIFSERQSENHCFTSNCNHNTNSSDPIPILCEGKSEHNKSRNTDSPSSIKTQKKSPNIIGNFNKWFRKIFSR